MQSVNKYLYDEITVGHTECFSVEITDEMQSMFLSISGDINPMHVDDSLAHKRGFSGKIVYGMLIASFYSKLVGTLLPGEKCLFQEADIKFRKPVFVGDVLNIKGECVEKNDTVKRLIIKARIRNQSDELVSTSKLKVGMLDG